MDREPNIRHPRDKPNEVVRIVWEHSTGGVAVLTEGDIRMAHSHFQINYLHFFVDSYLKDTSPVGRDLDFVTTSIEYRF